MMSRGDADTPLMGRSGRRLGVRVPPDPHPDITPDEHGNIGPGMGGMSVSPSVATLPRHRVPVRLKHLRSDATGDDRDACFRLGDVEFKNGRISEDLVLRMTSATHAVMEPIRTMTLGEYEAALEATQKDWVIDES